MSQANTAGQMVEVVEADSILGEMALIQQTLFFAIQVMSLLADRLRRWGDLQKAR